MHIPLPSDHHQLLLGELRVDHREGERMEGEIPSRKPGVLPFVRHGEYLIRIEMLPIMVATVLALLRRRRLRRITLEPAPDVIAVELLGPDHSSACLALDSAEVFV